MRTICTVLAGAFCVAAFTAGAFGGASAAPPMAGNQAINPHAGEGDVQPFPGLPQPNPQDRLPEPPGATPDAGQPVETDRDAGLADPKLRAQLLDKLYTELGEAKDPATAEEIDAGIRKLWEHTGSATIDLLMSHAVALESAKDYSKAMEVLDTALDLAPNTAEVWYLRARLYYLEGDDKAALADIDHTLSLDPKHYEAINGLGHIQAEAGETDQAAASFRRALQINPFLQSAKEGLRAVTSPPPQSEPAPQPSQPLGSGQPI